MLHLEPDGLGERTGAGTNAGTCAGVGASDEGVSSMPVGATTELPGICSPVAFGLSPRAKDKIHLSKSILRGICRWIEI